MEMKNYFTLFGVFEVGVVLFSRTPQHTCRPDMTWIIDLLQGHRMPM